MHKGRRHHLLVPSQYMGGGPQVKGFRGYGLAVEKNRESIFGFSLKLLWGRMSCWDGISPRRRKMGGDHLMHAIEVGNGEAYCPDKSSEKKKEIRNKTRNFVWEWGVVKPTRSEQW